VWFSSAALPAAEDLAYFEIEERHLSGGDVDVVNSMTIFSFDDDDIKHLDVYLQ
jgi:hypothetical protein